MWYIILVIAIIGLLFFTMKGRTVTVYGSMGCPWTVKQVDYLKQKNIGYTFVDCTSGECPDFVQGFPTTKVDDDIKVGYTEDLFK